MRSVSDLEKLWVFRRGRTGEREVMCRMSWDASFFDTVMMRKGEEGGEGVQIDGENLVQVGKRE